MTLLDSYSKPQKESMSSAEASKGEEFGKGLGCRGQHLIQAPVLHVSVTV